jgi:hypothetical protein
MLVEGNRLWRLPAAEVDATGIARLFISLFENIVSVKHLAFMVEHHHVPYVERLIEVLPELQSGFTLSEDDVATLCAVAPMSRRCG